MDVLYGLSIQQQTGVRGGWAEMDTRTISYSAATEQNPSVRSSVCFRFVSVFLAYLGAPIARVRFF